MGIIIKDSITLDSGLQVSNAYGNIGNNSYIRLSKTFGSRHGSSDTIQYMLEGQIHLWINQEKSIEGGTSNILKTYNVSVNKLDTPFTGNLYEILYEDFKNNYGFTCEDV